MIQKIPVAQLKPGMFVEDTGLSWLEHPFLYAQPGEVASEEVIQRIGREGFTEVFINTEKGQFAVRDVESSAQRMDHGIERDQTVLKSMPIQPRVPLAEELIAAEAVYKDSLKFARQFMSKVRIGEKVDMGQSEKLVDDMVASVLRNPDALFSLSKLRQFDEYTYTHSINVAALSLTFAHGLRQPDAALRELGIAALFHDVGKAKIPNEVLNKPGKLTDEEFAVMKSHSIQGHDFLKGQAVTSSNILRGVAEHHEKYDGSGYPFGLRGNEQHPFARLITVVDVFDALTSERVYKKGMIPHKALSLMFGLRGQSFFPGMVERFIKCLGIYPVGSFVRLSNGDHAVVSSSNEVHPLRPEIIVAFDKDVKPVSRPRKVDLTRIPEAELRIAECLDGAGLGVDALAVLSLTV